MASAMGFVSMDDIAIPFVDPGFGRLLASRWFAPISRGPTVAELAAITKIDPARWQAVLDGSALLDADMAIALAFYWDEPIDYFLRLQARYQPDDPPSSG